MDPVPEAQKHADHADPDPQHWEERIRKWVLPMAGSFSSVSAASLKMAGRSRSQQELSSPISSRSSLHAHQGKGSVRGSQRDVVYLGCPIATSNMSPNAGGGEGCGVGSQPMSLYVQLCEMDPK